MPSKDIKNPPGLRRPPLNPKGVKRARSESGPVFTGSGDVGFRDDPAWKWFLRVFILLMIVAVIVVISNAYQYYKRPFVSYQVEKGDIVTAVYGKGRVEPRNVQKVLSLLPDIAVVNAVNAEVGNVVKEGTLLIEISDKILLSRILSADQMVQYQEMTYKGALLYLKQRYATDADVAVKKQALDDAKNRLDYYINFLEDTKIYAQRNGTVLLRNVDPEDTISPGEELMWIGEPSPRWVMIVLEEEEARKVNVGDKARLYIGYKFTPRMKEYDYEGTIMQIVPPLEYKDLRFEKATYEIYIELAHDDRSQPPSLTPARAEILRKHVEDVPWVQYRSLYKYNYVLVKDPDGTVSARYVELGAKDYRGNKVEIIRGVKPGDEIMVFPEDYVARFGDLKLPGVD